MLKNKDKKQSYGSESESSTDNSKVSSSDQQTCYTLNEERLSPRSKIEPGYVLGLFSNTTSVDSNKPPYDVNNQDDQELINTAFGNFN